MSEANNKVLGKRFLFVGILDVPWSTNVPMKREFEKAGCEVDDFNYRTIAKKYASPRFYKLKDKIASLLQVYYLVNGRRQMSKKLLEKVRKNNYDLVFLSKVNDLDFHIIDEINKYSKTWYFFMDPKDRAKRMRAQEYAKRATWASATFTDVNELFRAYGANSIWLTQGVNTELFYPQKFKKEYDVVFVGHTDKKRRKLVNYLTKNNIQIICFGNGWRNKPVFEHDLVDIYRRAKIILNICKEGSGFSIRVFQAMGTGSFMLSEYCPDLEKIFQRKKHLDWFKSKEECLELIKYYLKNENEREKIAAQGASFVLENYSWEKIIKKIYEKIKTCNSMVTG